MSDDIVNVHNLKARLSQLVARAEKGERITIARAGKPIAQLGPASPQPKGTHLPQDEPLLNLDTFAVDGSRGGLTNEEIDRTLYGGS